MQEVRGCVERIRPLFNAILGGDRATAEQLTAEICRYETAADAIKDEIRSSLPKSIFLPIDRRDLLEILHRQDSVADLCQDIAVLMTLREMHLPEELRPLFERLVDEVTKVCMSAVRLIGELDELVETTFGGHEAEKVLQMIQALNAEETVTDGIGIEIARKLFTFEDRMSPVEVMLWFRVFRQVGDLANLAEGIGNRLRLLIAK